MLLDVCSIYSTSLLVKAHSHCCIFPMLQQQTVVFLQRDRNFPISMLTQSTAENADYCGTRESALKTHSGLCNSQRKTNKDRNFSNSFRFKHPTKAS